MILKKLLSALLICALPMIGVAAETTLTAEDQKTAVPAKPLTSEASNPEQSLRLGYVDVARLNQESEAGKAAQAQAKAKQKTLQSQLESRRKQLDKQKTALEGKFATLSPAQRDSKAKEFQKKVEEFQKFGIKAEKELQELQEKLLEDLFKTVEEAAAEYGKANELALVIVKRELLYLSNAVDAQDVTDGILTLLNEKTAKK